MPSTWLMMGWRVGVGVDTLGGAAATEGMLHHWLVVRRAKQTGKGKLG